MAKLTPKSAPKTTKKQKVEAIREWLLTTYGAQKSELVWRNHYELLICVMLSAQCTDKRVNMVTPALFAAYPNIDAMAAATLESVKNLIKSVSFFNNKAANLISMAKRVRDEFHGEIPLSQEELKSLPGVGQKTANVVMIEAANANFMAVDTHVFRTAHRLGLSKATTATKCEEELSALFKTDLASLHQAFVLFGRYTCKAVKPECDKCGLGQFCVSKESFKAR